MVAEGFGSEWLFDDIDLPSGDDASFLFFPGDYRSPIAAKIK